MAAKTVVCQECGTPAAPGRYACAECGSLLASVAVTARSSGSPDPDAAELGSEPDPAGTGEDESISAAESEALAQPAASAETRPAASAETQPAASAEVPGFATVQRAGATATPSYQKLGRPRPTAPPTDLLPDADVAVPFDEDAPIGTLGIGHVGSGPDAVDDLPPGDGEGDEGEPIDDVGARNGAAPTLPGSVGPSAPAPTAAPAPAAAPGPALVPAATVPAAPVWPPPGDRPPVARPEPRIPAGAYLPPSAILPPLDAAPTGATAAGGASAATPNGASAAGWSDRASAALAGALDNAGVTAASRRTILIGASLSAIGIFLPWINGPPTEGPLAGYLERWGLAGAGMWLVLAGLIVLAIIAGSSGRPESWPIGLPAVAVGAFVFGLLWPYLVGGFGRSIGIWVVLVGAIVLVVGGLLDRRQRHDRPEPGVPSG